MGLLRAYKAGEGPLRRPGVEGPANKPDNLSGIPGIHMTEGKSGLLKGVL